MKTHIGNTLVNRSYLGNTLISNSYFDTFLPIDPESISGLLIHADALKSTVYVDGSGWISGIQNLGSLGGQFDPYPSPASVNPALPANFVQGTGNTKSFRFVGQTTNYMATMFFRYPSSYTPKTTISIAKRDVFSAQTNPQMYTHAFGTHPGYGTMIEHPRLINSNVMDGGSGAGGNVVSPDSPLDPYVNGDLNYTMFAWSSPDYFAPTDSRFQTTLENSTSATYTGTTPSQTLTAYFVNSYSSSTNPGAANTGTTQHIAHMVYDSVLTETQIKGIYNYYNITRGYLMN